MGDIPESAMRVGKIEAGRINLSGKVAMVTGGGRRIGATPQCAALVRQAKEAYGQVGILVSNAGIGQPHKIVDTPDEEWERVVRIIW